MTFADTGIEITEGLARTLAREGISTPTAVQAAAIPVVLAGTDVVIQAGTGTGKTLAYLLPLLQRCRREPQFRAVVIAPSPELAMQILRTAEACKEASVASASLVGSGNIERQKERLKKHPQLLVGTPGRVLEMIFARKVQTKSITVLVLDEIDQILSEQNESELREICSRPEFQGQFVVASATFGKRAEGFCRDFMKEERKRLQLEASPLKESIHHHYIVFKRERSEAALAGLIKKLRMEAVLVFVHKGYSVAKLFHTLQDHDLPCVTLSAAGNRHARAEALEAFRSGKARVLVATDAAARGLDIKDLAWVVHFELANDKQAYLHRAGRTGRAGKTGTSIVMLTESEMPELERQARDLKIQFTPLPERL
jgi:ATP-dependent RNA helicase DeaD